MPMLNKYTAQRKSVRLLVFSGGTRSKESCPGKDSKTQLLAERSIEDLPDYVDVELFNMSITGDGIIVQPCKGCIGTAGGYHCHWPCTCYGPKSGGEDLKDWMYENDVYKKLEECDGFAVFSPIHWYNTSGSVKAMFDRLVCGSETLTKEEAVELTDGHIKDPEITEELSKSGDYDHLLKNHLEGKFAAFFVHGDSGADDYTTKPKPKSLTMYIDDEAETDEPYNAIRGIVNTCRYMGIFVPTDLINALHINKGIDYAEAEDRLKANEEIFEDARSMILKLTDYIESHKVET